MNIRAKLLSRRTFLLILFVTVALWAASPLLASAHAELLKSDPQSGALLDTAPTQIQLFLSESISLDFSQVQLYDRARTQIKLGPLEKVGGDSNSMQVAIAGPISPGTYTVVWRALSSTDGHLTEGTFAFRVKGGADSSEPIVPISLAGTGTTLPSDFGFDNADPFRWLVRALSLALAVLLLGGAIFTVLVIEPTAAEVRGEHPAGGAMGAEVYPNSSSFLSPEEVQGEHPAGGLGVSLISPPEQKEVQGEHPAGGLGVSPISLSYPPGSRRLTTDDEGASGESRGVEAQGRLLRRVAPVASVRFAMIGFFAAIVLLVLLLIDMALQVSLVDGSGLFGAVGRLDSALLILQTTRYGFAWLLKILATVLLIDLMFVAWRIPRWGGTWVWEVAQAGASLLLLAEALGSHGAAASESGVTGSLPIPIISYWLHLVTAGAWMGGVIYMVLALFPAFRKLGLSKEERRVFLGHSIPRFTRLAIISVVVLGITGLYNLVIHSIDIGTILSTAYGQLVALKIAAYLVLVGIGAINVRRITPMLLARAGSAKGAAGDGGPAASLGRNVRIEMALGAVALLCAGGLTLLPPPTNATGAALAATPLPAQVAQAPTPAPTPGPATISSEVAGYTFTLTTTPSLDGDLLVLDLTKTDPAAAPLTDVAKVLFKITPQDVNGGSISYGASAVGTPGADKQTWQSRQPFLTLDGGYLVTAIVQRTQSNDMKAAFRLDLSEDTGLKATPADVVDVLVATDPIEPISGTVVLTLTVLDGAHKPIDGAKVTITPAMPAHGHVSPSGVAQPVPGQAGTYTLPVQLNSGGSWLLTFTVERDGKEPIKTDASIDVADPNATPTPQIEASPQPSPSP